MACDHVDISKYCKWFECHNICAFHAFACIACRPSSSGKWAARNPVAGQVYIVMLEFKLKVSE